MSNFHHRHRAVGAGLVPARGSHKGCPYSARTKLRFLLRFALCVLVLSILLAELPQSAALQTNPADEFYESVNRIRLRAGLAPLGQSTLLTRAAQRHVDDVAQRGTASHQGSDDSTYQQRIREAGYRAWNDGLFVNETFWLGLGTAVDALTWFRNRPEEWALFTDPRYREMGVGYAEDGQGVRYFVITFGSRPGVLPIFVNEGAEVTDSPQVAVRLSNEEAEPLGEGSWIGKAIEVQLSNTPSFDGVPWQPWEPLLPWLLESPEPGDYAIYVQFRDGANRTAVAEATIRLVAPGDAPPTPTPLPDIIAQPSEPLPGAPTPTSATAPITGTVIAPPSQVTLVPTFAPDDREVMPTWTPLPDVEVETVEAKPVDWPLIVGFLLQGLAIILGFATFLRRRS